VSIKPHSQHFVGDKPHSQSEWHGNCVYDIFVNCNWVATQWQ